MASLPDHTDPGLDRAGGALFMDIAVHASALGS
jgi:hypothetical protein